MAIIISKDGKNARRIDKIPIEQEGYLQNYIHENPEALPVYEISEYIKLLIIAREFPTKSGPIDALGIDKDGEIYIIETKLYKNPDKRKVVAQVLDYGAALWAGYTYFNDFYREANRQVHDKFGLDLEAKLSEFFDLEENGAATVLDSINTNLNDGKFRFVILMDTLHERLKDLIVFMNQNTRFDIYAVEMEFYKYEEFEITIPKLFGSEVKKDTSVATDRGQIWDEEKFFDSIEDQIEDEGTLAIMKEIYQFAKENSLKDPWGAGQRTKGGTFNFFVRVDGKERSVLNISRNGWLCFYGFDWYEGYRQDLREIGFEIPEDAKEKPFEMECFKEKIDLANFKRAILKLIEELR